MTSDNLEMESVDPNKKCCLNCKAFESRTGFCRRHPPKPVPFQNGRNQQYCVPMFVKIALPAMDYCEDGIFNVDETKPM